ncbi:MAG: hypothetical protein KF830_07105 [Planctomycetes bacterium]|nr:hypothetical protein [Planctomycetota bacterium]
MLELLWFAAGAAIAGAACLLHRRQRSPASAAPPAPAPAEPATLAPGPVALEARRLARLLGEELANLVSGVEGQAQNLIRMAPDRRQLPRAAESLLAAVQRLRTLHTKVVAFGQGRTPAAGTTCANAVVGSLGDDLQQMQLGLEVRWEPAPALPPLRVAPDVARDALLFVASALLRAERGATQLSIQTELCLDDDEPCVQIELALEWVTEAKAVPSDPLAEPAFTLDLEAANNLVTGQGGALSLSHLPGHTVRAVVRWPAAPAASEAAPGTADALRPGAPVHRYGGALLLEADPAIRAMLASELKATGRAVFACADVAAARALLEATPDRFELLVVDHAQRLDADADLLPTIRCQVPDLKICVLGPGDAATARGGPPLHRIHKPFGVDELRRALASVLA